MKPASPHHHHIPSPPQERDPSPSLLLLNNPDVAALGQKGLMTLQTRWTARVARALGNDRALTKMMDLATHPCPHHPSRITVARVVQVAGEVRAESVEAVEVEGVEGVRRVEKGRAAVQRQANQPLSQQQAGKHVAVQRPPEPPVSPSLQPLPLPAHHLILPPEHYPYGPPRVNPINSVSCGRPSLSIPFPLLPHHIRLVHWLLGWLGGCDAFPECNSGFPVLYSP
jgi:hypothetical protein